MYKRKIVFISLLTLYVVITAGVERLGKKQIASPQIAAIPTSLYDSIVVMDSILFDAFNHRDIEKIKNLFTSDLEFYHDKGGLTNYEQNIAAMTDLFSRNNDLKRTLVAGSTEVFPVPGVGAIQTGSHLFCHTENGKPDCGTFKFLHIWRKENSEGSELRTLKKVEANPAFQAKNGLV